MLGCHRHSCLFESLKAVTGARVGCTYVYVCWRGGYALLEFECFVPALLWGKGKRRGEIRVGVQGGQQLSHLSH